MSNNSPLPYDFMLDFETLGYPPDGAVVDLAIVMFKNDPHNPPTFQQLVNDSIRVKFSIEDQKGRRVFDKSTIEWWKAQSADARKHLAPTSEDVTLEVGMGRALEYISQRADRKRTQGWCRGMPFDFGLMVDLIRQTTGERDTFHQEPCYFWKQRDVRTAIESTLMARDVTECPLPAGTLDGFVAHNSVHDVAKDVLMLLYAKRYAIGLDDIPTLEEADPNSLPKSR